MEEPRGHLFIRWCGDKEEECDILRRFLFLTGWRKAVLAVLSTASRDPEAGEQYREIFTRLGAAEIKILAVQNRKEAN